jgi:hypothetical protein
MLSRYAVTAFFGAVLLFLLEPLVGKELLPVLGGAPAVWGTCMVFFQVCLLAGYGWAHILSTRVPGRLQPVVHVLVAVACALTLPLRAPMAAPPSDQAFPMPWLLGWLALAIGPTFFLVSATGPLVSRWFHQARGKEPWVLYAASNAGSALALVAYPIAVEPFLRLSQQRSVWSIAYLAFIALLAVAGVPMLRGSKVPVEKTKTVFSFRWVGLAAAPSAMMIAATTFVTTDVAPIPLLWVIPLALYLASLVIPFLDRPIIRHEKVLAAMPIAVLVLGFAMLVGTERLIVLGVIVHFGALFVVSLACHGELARTKPPAEGLTSFYLTVAAGGAAGGVLAALVSPVLFPAVWEYPLSAAAACFLRIGSPIADVEPEPRSFERIAAEVEGEPLEPDRMRWVRAAIGPVLILAVLVAALRIVQSAGEQWRLLVLAQVATAVCVFVWWMRKRPVRFAILATAVLIAPEVTALTIQPLFRGRSFFSSHRVTDFFGLHLYIQGTTIHGLQSEDPARKRVAGAYFHASGPAGEILSQWHPKRAGLIGLGVGSLATYAEPGQSFTFYEIDPVVARIAEDAKLFSFVPDARARGAEVRIILGDARLELESADDGGYDLVVLDAYSSDVVPTHLLTREAFALYAKKLAPGGRILMNISNRYLDLDRVVAALVLDAHFTAMSRMDFDDTPEDHRAAIADGKAVSHWILVAREQKDWDGLVFGDEWEPLKTKPVRVWTDDYASVLSCFRFLP